MDTHYKTLQVLESASIEAVKGTYKHLSHKHHPDRGGDAELMKRINEAYRVLGDQQLRAEYDEWLAAERTAREVEKELRRGAVQPEEPSGWEAEAGPVKGAKVKIKPKIVQPGSHFSAINTALLWFVGAVVAVFIFYLGVTEYFVGNTFGKIVLGTLLSALVIIKFVKDLKKDLEGKNTQR